MTSYFSLFYLIALGHFFFYNNVVQKLELNKIHTTVPRQQYCVLTGENQNPIQQLQKPRKYEILKLTFNLAVFNK